MPDALEIALVGALAFVLNVPLGAWRARCRRLSPAWFVAVHASVPFLVLARILLGVAWPFIPVFVALAVLGQWLGGRLSAPRSRR